MRTIGVGLIGTGFMGKCHTLAYRSVKAVFDTVLSPRLVRVCDRRADVAQRHAAKSGFEKATDDWRAVVEDPDVDIVSITTPNKLHCEMALAALEAGKHVHCEKPLALTLDEAERMAAAAAKATGKTIVGYSYLCNPLYQHARALVRAGAIGRPLFFRGVCDEDLPGRPGAAVDLALGQGRVRSRRSRGHDVPPGQHGRRTARTHRQRSRGLPHPLRHPPLCRRRGTARGGERGCRIRAGDLRERRDRHDIVVPRRLGAQEPPVPGSCTATPACWFRTRSA